MSPLMQVKAMAKNAGVPMVVVGRRMTSDALRAALGPYVQASAGTPQTGLSPDAESKAELQAGQQADLALVPSEDAEPGASVVPAAGAAQLARSVGPRTARMTSGSKLLRLATRKRTLKLARAQGH